MAQIRPFAAIRYVAPAGRDVSALIAPPYDVLDERGKGALQARHPNNIVSIDLPHLPPKTVGPDLVYQQANATLQAWLKDGVLARDRAAGLYPYVQTYDWAGRTFRRRGFFALVRLSPFGAGEVVPHEKTYDAPIEDRLKLMRATGVQLSPIFGLFKDPANEITDALYQGLGSASVAGTLEGVKNEMWAVDDPAVHQQVVEQMRTRAIYIADGHHRYTTALKYQQEVRQRLGQIPDEHPANWCLFVLIGMQDPGLQILPTHRLIGGLRGFDIEMLKSALAGVFDVSEVAGDVGKYAAQILPQRPAHTMGFHDGRTRKTYELRLLKGDVLTNLEPSRSDAWRSLDVAILQRYLLDEIIGPKFAAGGEVSRGYTANPAEVAPQVDGDKYQVALLLQSTPLSALEELGRVGEVMPQKSTYFYPKLATGMVINSI